jgi:hypothetical protein
MHGRIKLVLIVAIAASILFESAAPARAQSSEPGAPGCHTVAMAPSLEPSVSTSLDFDSFTMFDSFMMDRAARLAAAAHQWSSTGVARRGMPLHAQTVVLRARASR